MFVYKVGKAILRGRSAGVHPSVLFAFVADYYFISKANRAKYEKGKKRYFVKENLANISKVYDASA